MWKIVLRRLIMGVVLLLVVSALIFVLVSLIPGDAAQAILGPNASEAQLEALRAQLHLDLPLWQRYLEWVTAALHGDLGTSTVTPQAVTVQLNKGLAVSVPLALGAVLISSLIGITLGTFAAVRGGALSRSLDIVALLGMALPTFWIALVFSNIFGVQLRWFPATGFTSFDDDPVAWLRSLVLPVAALCIGGIAGISRQSRDSIDDTLSREFVDALRVQGYSRRRILFGHVAKTAAIPTIAMIGGQFVTVISSAVLVESVFGLPGLGSIAIRATLNRDLPVIVAAAIYICLIVIVVNLVLDLVYAAINPKVRVKA
ncbi:MAG: ABC transporter permease [Microbacterium sp.]|uniref:ABC transporter permease n=1 Tax=Microbacterium sp. TaxID=51671 RepID=UPI0039E6D8BA